MKFLKWFGLGFLVVLGLLVWRGVSTYNTLTTAEQTVKQSWSNVETQYQRRADLIPNLVKTVEGQAGFEKSTLESVIKARASATQVKLDPSTMTEEDLQRFQSSQNALSSSLSRLLVTVEKYPELKAHSGFTNLQVQLEGTENRINFARQEYNKVVTAYNTQLKQFPTVVIGRLLGFTEKPYFKANPGSEQAPNVEFNFGSTPAPATN